MGGLQELLAFCRSLFTYGVRLGVQGLQASLFRLGLLSSKQILRLLHINLFKSPVRSRLPSSRHSATTEAS